MLDWSSNELGLPMVVMGSCALDSRYIIVPMMC